MKLRAFASIGLFTLLYAAPSVSALPVEEELPPGVSIIASADGAGGPVGSNPNHPRDVWVDADGNVFILQGGNQITKIATDGAFSAINASSPNSVSTGPDGTIYYASTAGDHIRMIDTEGVDSVVDLGGVTLTDPEDVVVDESGNLFIADTAAFRVIKVNAAGQVTVLANNTDLTYPRGLVVDDAGDVYIANTSRSNIVKVDAEGTISVAASDLIGPADVAVDDDGNIYVADSGNNRIQKINARGGVSTVNTGTLSSPSSVTVDTYGNLYVADTGNNRVLKVRTDLTPPTISNSTPDEATEGDDIVAAFACADEGAAGLKSCEAALDGEPIADGATIETTVGTKSLTITARDFADNATTEVFTITVAAAEVIPDPEPTPKPGPRELVGNYAAMSGTEGSIARLYMAVFLRQPDAAGHAFWVKRAEAGMSLQDMAQFFITSPEFSDTYDDLENPGFVDLLYLNVMVRKGETEGTAFWNSQLDQGASRAWVTLFFSESPEFRVLTKTS